MGGCESVRTNGGDITMALRESSQMRNRGFQTEPVIDVFFSAGCFEVCAGFPRPAEL